MNKREIISKIESDAGILRTEAFNAQKNVNLREYLKGQVKGLEFGKKLVIDSFNAKDSLLKFSTHLSVNLNTAIVESHKDICIGEKHSEGLKNFYEGFKKSLETILSWI